METTRPLMRMGVADLEELFKEQSQNAFALAELDGELAQRRGTRALVLRERIRRTQKRLETEGASLGSARSNSMPAPPDLLDTSGSNTLSEGIAPVSPPLVEKQGHASAGLALKQPVVQQDLLFGLHAPTATPTLTKTGSFPATEMVSVKKPSLAKEPEALPQIALEDAYRILKLSAGDVWEKVEVARRKIVLMSNPLVTKELPMAQVQKLLAEARLANDAAIVIAARRSGRQ